MLSVRRTFTTLNRLMITVTQINTTFIGGSPTWANACVGENGFPGYWDYAKGFSQAATMLIDLVLRERGLKHPVDEMVYPVCFNMRHSVELRLKGAITELTRIEKIRCRDLQFDFAESHDIGNIWRFFTEKARAVDDRYEPIILGLHRKITDIAEVDATGQTFRYPLSTDSQKHLVDISIINFVVLKQSFSELEAALDNLHRLSQYLCDEYAWKSFTKRLSRKNLFEIARLLPPKSRWTEESFASTKSVIKKKFNIGSKELTASINHIKSHFELAPEIGVSIPLLGIEDDNLQEFFHFWLEQHDLPSDKDHINFESIEWDTGNMFDNFAKASAMRKKIWDAVNLNLTSKKLAGLSALFYFARELDFSEKYIQIYEQYLREAEAAFLSSEDSVRTQYFHIFEKTNAIYNILQSLYFLRKTELADQLVVAYGLDEKFSWIEEARKRVLFRKPDYCGYAI